MGVLAPKIFYPNKDQWAPDTGKFHAHKIYGDLVTKKLLTFCLSNSVESGAEQRSLPVKT